jgi:hypothetical protein
MNKKCIFVDLSVSSHPYKIISKSVQWFRGSKIRMGPTTMLLHFTYDTQKAYITKTRFIYKK